MLSTSTALKTQIDSQVQAPAALVEVDLEGDGLDILDDISPLVESWSIDRTITSDVPDGTRLVAGYATAEANVTLSGADSSGHDAAWVFSPANTLSQYYGKHRVGAPAKIKMGFKAPTTPEYLDRFTGQVRELTTDGAARTASMSFLDVADKLKTPVNLPMITRSYLPSVNRNTDLFPSSIMGARPNLSASWFIDYALRKNGVFSGTPTRTEAVYYASMRGSAAPSRGTMQGAYAAPAWGLGTRAADGDVCNFGPGRNGQIALMPPSSGNGHHLVTAPSSIMALASGDYYRVEGWFKCGATLADLTGYASVHLEAVDSLGSKLAFTVGISNDRKLFADISGQGATSTLTVSSTDWAYVQFDIHVVSNNQVTVTPRLNGTAGSVLTLNGTDIAFTDPTAAVRSYIRLSGADISLSSSSSEFNFCLAGVEGLQVSYTTSSSVASAWTNYHDYSPTATLEPSLNMLTATPFSEDAADPWALIQAITAAEYGVSLFDEQGIFRFWNRNHFGSGQSVDYTAKTVTINGVTVDIPTITSDRELLSLSTVESIDSVRNRIQVTATPVVVNPADWVWQNGDATRIGIRGSVTLVAQLDNPAIDISTDFSWLGRGLSTGATKKSGYRACRRLDGLSDPVTNLQFKVTVSGQTATIVVTNPNDYYCYLVSPQQAPSADPTGFTGNYDASVIGQPYLWLWGQTVSTTQSITDNSVSQSSDATGSYVEVSDSDSDAAYGTQSLPLGNEWVQGTDIARTLATDLLAMLARPAPYLGDTAVLGDPRLQIGDRVELTDSTGSGVSLQAWIVGIPSEEYNSTDGYTQTLTLRLVAGFGGTCFNAPDAKFNSSIFDGVY